MNTLGEIHARITMMLIDREDNGHPAADVVAAWNAHSLNDMRLLFDVVSKATRVNWDNVIEGLSRRWPSALPGVRALADALAALKSSEEIL